MPSQNVADPDSLTHTKDIEEILSQDEFTRMIRRRATDGSSQIIKEALGPKALQRLLREKEILDRLSGIEGVSQLASVQPANALALVGHDTVPFMQIWLTQPFELPRFLEFASQLVKIVAAVHRCGVMHKNIQPDNILLADEQQRVLLVGFRLASAFAEEEQTLVHHREIEGALAYLAPEQTGRTGWAVDQRADLYALGVTFYEMATGHVPFEGDDPLQVIHDHLARVPKRPSELDPRISKPLSDIIMRLLEKAPDQRYQSAEGVIHDLARLRSQFAQGNDAPFPLGERDFPLRLLPPSRLIGREKETAALQDALNDTRNHCRAVFVSGAPGDGKSVLIGELRAMVTARRGWFLAGKFDQYRKEIGGDAVGLAMRTLAKLLLAEPEAELAQHRKRMLAALGDNAAAVAAMMPEFVPLLGVTPQAMSGDPSQLVKRLSQAVVDMLGAAASPSRPLILAIDNLQWAGAQQLILVDTLLSSDGLKDLLFVGTYRADDIDAEHPLTALLSRWQQFDPPPLQLRLANLPPESLAELLAKMMRLPAQQASHLAAHIGARTHGNPFDTIELINALRHDGALVPGEEGWHWDEATIRRFVGQGDTLDLLVGRIARLPRETQDFIAQLGCLGGEAELGLLAVTSALPVEELEACLAPALEDGLLVMAQNGDTKASSRVFFRNHRVQQAAHGQLDVPARSLLHLTIARRLAANDEFTALAAEQYLYAVDAIVDPDERRRVVGLLHAAAANARHRLNPGLAQRFLTAALALMAPESRNPDEADAALFGTLETELHAALYSIGRLDEADTIYRKLEARCTAPLALAEAACSQMCSLTNRGMANEAMTLGLDLLRRLGLEPPQDIGSALPGLIDEMSSWVSSASRSEDLIRPDTSDPRVLAMAKLIDNLQMAVFASDQRFYPWMVVESQRLWALHGPCAALMASLISVMPLLVVLRQDYRTGNVAARHILTVGEARGYEPATSMGRYGFSSSIQHWFAPLEACAKEALRAREGLLRSGKLQIACLSYNTTICILFESSPTLDDRVAEVEVGLAFVARTGDDYTGECFLTYRQLIRSLRGDTAAPGSFNDDDFDESAYQGINPFATTFFQINRALSAALFGDTPALISHAAAAMPLLRNFAGYYPTVLAYLLQSLSLAAQIKAATQEERETLLAEFDDHHKWMALRAADTPVNFLHLLKWIEAERAWAVGDQPGAIAAFDAALLEAASRQRPWHRALICERAGLCHLEQRLEYSGRSLLAESRRHYDAWGASAKVQQMTERHTFLREVPGLRRRADKPGGGISSDLIDMTAILTASQALSSETNPDRLKQRVSELLGSLTGATLVRVVVWRDDLRQWILSADEGNSFVAMDAPAAQGLLPLSAFHYVERTLDTLLVDDAKHDDRFAADPYVAGLERCSLMVVPILSQGKANAVLLLENHLGSGAFTTDRLDAVKLIAGQLSVSLDNALLYEKLEKRVQERTQQLHDVQSELMSTARQAGMAEIANNVLHNVGNVLNSVNISAGLVSKKMRDSKAQGLARAMQLMNEHATDLGDFLTRDEKGKLLPGYLNKLVAALAAEQQSIVEELGSLTKSVDHIKDIVSTQQSYAGAASIVEPIQIRDLLEDALRMNVGLSARHDIEVVREYADVPLLLLDKPRILQIFVNLISNAKQAMDAVSDRPRRITLGIGIAEREGGHRLLATVADNGVGVLPENLARIFSHGFTTRKEGHGFGLHSCVLAAKEMGGTLTLHSDGPGKGATFTLELPANTEGGVQ